MQIRITLAWMMIFTLGLIFQEPLRAQTDLRVVSYNIKHGLGNDGALDLARTAEVLNKLEPDVVGLQEVDEKATRSESVDQAAFLGKQLAMQHSFGSFMDFQGGRYGMAILSRYPILESEQIRLPEGNEPRVALVVTVRLPDGRRVTFVNVHFDWVRDDAFRFQQATVLKKYLDSQTLPIILLGDFNDGPDSRTVRLLGKGALEADKPEEDRFTFSATQPRKEIDFLFGLPAAAWKCQQVDVVDEPVASDHRPVFSVWRLLSGKEQDASDEPGQVSQSLRDDSWLTLLPSGFRRVAFTRTAR